MKKLIMDVDTGIDDSLAIAYAITLEDYDLIGITAAFGNVDQLTSQKNALTILDILGRSDVKVYPGLMGIEGNNPYVSSSLHVHGPNGLGGVEFAQSKRKAEEISAIEFLSSSIERYGTELVIYAAGPLANLAELFRVRPDLVKRTGKIVIMGGSLFVRGNRTPIAESNIYNDPEDAAFLFSLGLDIVLVGLDVTEKLILTRNDMDLWTSDVGQKFRRMTEFYIEFHNRCEPNAKEVCFMHDPAAVCYLDHPEYFKTLTLPVKVLLSGYERGRTIASFREGIPETTQFCIEVDKIKAEKAMKDSWLKLFG